MAAPTSLNIRRFILTHRRLLAAGFAGLAVLFALAAMKPATTGTSVVVARHDLPSGTALTAGDVKTATLPVGSKPAHAAATAERLLGRRTAGPMRAGEIITDFRLLAPGLLKGYAKDSVLATIRLADPTQLASLRVGDHVNVIGSDPEGESAPTVIARRAEIVALPRTQSDNNSPPISVAVPEKVGIALATAGLEARLSVLAVS